MRDGRSPIENLQLDTSVPIVFIDQGMKNNINRLLLVSDLFERLGPRSLIKRDRP